MLTLRTLAASAALATLAAMVAPPSAKAGIIFETAAYTGVDTGEYIVQSTRWIGAVFTLTKTTEITGIGGQFGGYPSGEIFGAVVAVSPATGVPSFDPSDIAANALGLVNFAAPSQTTDLTEALDLTLAAGSYAVVFGSLDPYSWGGLGDGNTTVGSPQFVQSAIWDNDGAWTSQPAGAFDGVRITVSGVPELSTWAMIAVGFAGLGLGARNRMRTARAFG